MKKIIYLSLLMLNLWSGFSQTNNIHLYSYMTDVFYPSFGDSLTFWGYGYYLGPGNVLPTTLPAPLLKVKKDEDVSIHFHNLSGEDHTIHLHGLDVDTRNDGVPHTWWAVDPNDSIVYSFNSPYPGSYLYHCHVMTVHHLAMGMYGMLIVKNYPDTNYLFNGGPGFNKEYQFLFSDMDTAWNANPTSPGHLHNFHPNYFMVNGKASWQLFNGTSEIINAQANDSILVHFGNIGYTSVQLNFPSQMNARIYMSDGRPLPESYFTDSLRIFPGERYEVVFKPTVNYNGYIGVTHHNAVLDSEQGANFIGINSYVHPNTIHENSELKNNPFLIFPNPATNQVSVQALVDGKYTLIDQAGNILQTGKINSGINTLTTSNLPSGMYFILVNGVPAKIVITGN